ncbi:MAG: histidine phosphatase family protein [Sphaerochaetaceae bacterium]
MKRVLLIRHGESHLNAKGDCFSGLADTPLSDAGRVQAKRLRPLLETLPIDAVYASPLCRAEETARLALPGFSQSVQTAHCLLEFDYGDYDGLSYADFKDDDPVIQQWKHNPASLCFPHGGCISHHADQAFNALEELVEHADGNVFACFSHKTTIRLIVSKVLSLPLDYFRRVPCGNASVTTLCFEQGLFSVESVNLTATFFTASSNGRAR